MNQYLMGQGPTEVLWCFRNDQFTPEEIVERLIRRGCSLGNNYNLTAATIAVARELAWNYDNRVVDFDYSDMLDRWDEIYSTASERAEQR